MGALLPLRTIWGLGPIDPGPDVPEPTWLAAWPTPAEPFLWSRGVWAGVESLTFWLLSPKQDKGNSFKPINLCVIQTSCFTGLRT